MSIDEDDEDDRASSIGCPSVSPRSGLSGTGSMRFGALMQENE